MMIFWFFQAVRVRGLRCCFCESRRLRIPEADRIPEGMCFKPPSGSGAALLSVCSESSRRSLDVSGAQ